MNSKLKAIWKGIVEGAWETPREFFAPVIGCFMVMDRAADEVLARQKARKEASELFTGQK